jgi:hypothetical protein
MAVEARLLLRSAGCICRGGAMNSADIPDIAKLMEATVELLQRGTSNSVTKGRIAR